MLASVYIEHLLQRWSCSFTCREVLRDPIGSLARFFCLTDLLMTDEVGEHGEQGKAGHGGGDQ